MLLGNHDKPLSKRRLKRMERLEKRKIEKMEKVGKMGEFKSEKKELEEMEGIGTANTTPCYELEDDEDFIRITYKGEGVTLDNAMKASMYKAKSELTAKLKSIDRYKELMKQGISYSLNKECEKIENDEDGMYIYYVTVSVAKEELEKHLEQ